MRRFFSYFYKEQDPLLRTELILNIIICEYIVQLKVYTQNKHTRAHAHTHTYSSVKERYVKMSAGCKH